MLRRHRSSASTETHQAHTRRQYARMRTLRHKRTGQRAHTRPPRLQQSASARASHRMARQLRFSGRTTPDRLACHRSVTSL